MSIAVAPTVGAMVSGVGSIVGLASLVESTSPAPAFDPLSDRFDQGTFRGRFSKMFLACDPMLLTRSGGEVERCKALLKDFGAGKAPPPSARTLWEAKRTVDACLHPDTGEVIPQPFRMSGYLPYNGPISTMMVASTTTPR